MKTLKILFLVAIATVTFTACADYENIIVDETGVWNVDKYTYEEFEDGVLVDSTREEIANDGTITFNEDMTGIAIDAANDSTEFTWRYDSDNEVLTLTYLGFFAIAYDVVDFNKDSQTLTGEFVDGSNRQVTTLELSK